MEQKEHINVLIASSDEKKRRAERIQISYEKYVEHNLNHEFDVLLTELDAYCVSWVRKELWKTGCFSDENEHAVMQESRLSVWKIVEGDKRANVTRDNFAYYAFGVYKHKTLNKIREFSAYRKKYDEHSFDEPIGDGDKTLEDKIPSIKFEQEIVKDESRKLYERLFYTYCKAFMSSSTFPPRCLALYYARVLPHLTEDIPDTKATSAKWAFERMGFRTVGELKIDSENTLQNHVDNTLCWCDDFIRQLSEEVSEKGNTDLLMNIVYTDVYDKGKIEDWADYMHKASTKSAMNMVLKNPELLELAKEYISQKDVLFKFVERGECR